MDLDIRNKNFAIFGGSRGMGWETLRALAEDGANVYILCRNPASCEEKALKLSRENNVNIVALACDVTIDSSVDNAVADILKQCGRIHGVAVTNYDSAHGPEFTKMNSEDWDARYQDVFMGSIRVCKALIPHMAEHSGGSIVVTASFSALSPIGTLYAYASQKAALIHVAKNLANNYGQQGIRVNCVCPGYIKTARAEERLASALERGAQTEAEAEALLLDKVDMNIALNRLGEAREVGDTIAFLLSDRSSYTSGAVISIDGAASG